MLFLALHLIFRTAVVDDWDYWELVGLFDMDSEISLFSWYSATILLFVPAVLLFYIGWIKRKAGEKLSWGWFLASAMFLFISIDDSAMIHEKISTLNRLSGLQDVLNSINPYLFAWSWWVVYLPIVAIFGVILIRWYISLPHCTKIIIAAAIFLVVGGQVGMEMISSFVSNSTGEYVSVVWRGLQKFTGRLGLSLFLFAVIDYIAITPSIRCRFEALFASNATARK